jgi:hypothetical protein
MAWQSGLINTEASRSSHAGEERGKAVIHWGRGGGRNTEKNEKGRGGRRNGAFAFIWIFSLKMCLQF